MELYGNSGCKVELIESADRYIVRKSALSKKSSDNLISQYSLIRSSRISAFRLPHLISCSGIDSERFSYEMEYISGDTAIGSIINSDGLKMDALLDCIKNHFTRPLQISTVDSTVARALLKLQSLQGVSSLSEDIEGLLLSTRDYAARDNMLPLATQDSEELADGLHGDLSLENILITKEGIVYAIDLHRHYLNSILGDLTKILFDVIFYFSLTNNVSLDEPGLAASALRLKRVETMLSQLSLYRYLVDARIFKPLVAIECLRVLPYIHDGDFCARLEKRLISFLHS